MSTPALQRNTGTPLCAKCGLWLCASDDAFCGGCGAPCAQLILDAVPAVLPLGQLPPRLGVKLTNTTCAHLRIQSISAPSWLEIAADTSEGLAPGASKSILAKARINQLKTPESSELVFSTNIGDASVLLMLIPETPAVASVPANLMHWPERSGDFQLNFAPTAGQLRILRFNNPMESWLTLTSAPETPALVSPRAPLNLSVRFDPSRARLNPSSQQKTLTTSIPVEYESAHGSSIVPLKISIDFRNAPELTLVGEHAPPKTLLRSAGQAVQLTLSNLNPNDRNDRFAGRQNGILEIDELTLLIPTQDHQLSVHSKTPLPVLIEGGHSADFEFICDLDHLLPGIHYLNLFARTNSKALTHNFRIAIEVREMEIFEGVLAIDFGTSNTSCALWSQDGDITSVVLDGARTTDPTLVRYLDLSTEPPLIETGDSVKRNAARIEQVAASTVNRLKQHLGEATFPLSIRPANSEDWLMREASRAAADYLRHIRLTAEKQAKVKFQQFILTHPAVCSLQQYRNLRNALNEAFGDTAEIQFLQEPIASLIPLIAHLAANVNAGCYTVAAFDIGGGTSDITVVRVNHQPSSSGVLEIRPEIITSWGERFGGEDLTDFLVADLKNRCGKILQARRPGYSIADKGVLGASAGNIRSNEARLREWADQFKASLSEEENVAASAEDLRLTVVPERADLFLDEEVFLLRDLNQQGEDLTTVFLSAVESAIDRLATRLAKSASSLSFLDIIHLSGKTSFLGVVMTVLKRHFPNSKITRPPDPKECVVKGACLSRSLLSGQTRRLVLDSAGQRTTSQIGIVDEAQVFHQLIGLDKPIPETGLTIDFPNAWNGQSAVVLWENLGAENHLILHDHSKNRLITKLGTWEPLKKIPSDNHWCSLRLTLHSDFTLSVAGFSNTELVGFRLRESRRSAP